MSIVLSTKMEIRHKVTKNFWNMQEGSEDLGKNGREKWGIWQKSSKQASINAFYVFLIVVLADDCFQRSVAFGKCCKRMPRGGIKRTIAFAFPKTTFASSFGDPEWSLGEDYIWTIQKSITVELVRISYNIIYAFNICLLSTFSNTVICWMAIWLSLCKRSCCGIPSLIKTAFRFSMLLRQINWLMVA